MRDERELTGERKPKSKLKSKSAQTPHNATVFNLEREREKREELSLGFISNFNITAEIDDYLSV